MNRMESGCAIMVLVEGVTGIATQSYATDSALLAELRAGWPPADAPARGSGYRPTNLAVLDVAAAIRLTDRYGVALAADEGAFVVLPVVRDGADGWREAGPGDGLSALVAGVPMASERAIVTDQTNESVVVGERAIIKWSRRVGPGPSRATTLTAHLDALGFAGIPEPLGTLTWQSPAGAELTLARGDTYLPDARDGWGWCVARLEAHLAHDDGACPPGCDPLIGEPLGRLVADLHVALATPSDVIPEPAARATAEDALAWATMATATLDEAILLQDAERKPELESLVSPIRNVLGALRIETDTPIQPVHGDLHVGQVLEWSGGLAIIDFDGNPALGDASNALRQPAARDVAQMATSLDHVGRIVAERVDAALMPRVSSWIADTKTAFLDAYTAGLEAAGSRDLFDDSLLAPFEVEQECRELVYAARFLPRWRYAPMAALRARFRGR
jgi:maltokinase